VTKVAKNIPENISTPEQLAEKLELLELVDKVKTYSRLLRRHAMWQRGPVRCPASRWQ
jgi:hypothetical protein